MHFSFSKKLGRIAAAAALIGLVGGVAPGIVQAQDVGNATSQVSTGVVKRVGPANAQQPSAMIRGTATPRVIPLRRPPHGIAPAAVGPSTVRASASAAVAASPVLLHNFNGVSSTDNLNASGIGLEPPDEGLGVSKNDVVNIVNLAFTIYTPSGSVLAGPIGAPAFFNEPQSAGTELSDPRVYFDDASNRWFMTIFQADDGSASGTASSHVDIAVSDSANPTQGWIEYQIDTTDAVDSGCPCLPDFPILGIDKYNLYISTNEFSIAGPEFNGAQVYAIPKAQLESASGAVGYVHYGDLSVGGTLAYHLQPAITYGNAPAEYFMSSLDPNSTFDTRLAVWALTDPQTVAQGEVPGLSATVISSEAYGFPVKAQTPPGFNSLTNEATTGLVTADFDAMQEVEYIGGHLLGALDTSVTIPGDPSPRDGIAWFDVQPKVKHGAISQATAVAAQGYVASQGLYLLYPHIEQNPQGLTAMAFTFAGPGTDLSAGYATMPSGSSDFGPIMTAAAGAASDNGFTGTPSYGGVGRWGDYSAGEFDAAGNIWLATEYIPGQGDNIANWGNRIFAIQK